MTGETSFKSTKNVMNALAVIKHLIYYQKIGKQLIDKTGDKKAKHYLIKKSSTPILRKNAPVFWDRIYLNFVKYIVLYYQ